ncbi:hypothetical protein JVU11DRAFT_2134 [Chiua virens]|nr:hypothetical protein JVU11DRAFT_2134 [Chiua virens]
MFLELGITTSPEYPSIIKLGREQDGILLDIGCCFGVDARKVVADGFPLRNVVTSDLKTEFFDMGHALFNTTPATYPINFVAGDAFDPHILKIVPPSDERPSTEKPDLTTLTSLNPLAGRCAVIYASKFFHLFSEENQLHLAKALAGLLSAQPGSMICGEHSGSAQKGTHNEEHAGRTITMFGHSPESWCAIWDGEVFAKGTVRVNATLEPKVIRGTLAGYDRLQWSVVRM